MCSGPAEGELQRAVQVVEGGGGGEGEDTFDGWVGDGGGAEVEGEEVVGALAGGFVGGPVDRLAGLGAVGGGAAAGAAVESDGGGLAGGAIGGGLVVAVWLWVGVGVEERGGEEREGFRKEVKKFPGGTRRNMRKSGEIGRRVVTRCLLIVTIIEVYFVEISSRAIFTP